jgi:hypothetical protein
MLAPDALRLVDDVYERLAAAPDGPPGLAWGVVAGGSLAHAGSAGTVAKLHCRRLLYS